ncbi:MAG: FAD binding domain-containing protein, partial [Victivallales bacterium]|nr:FAD binding domain-containing protein [Victivallales bacterium]
MKIVDFVSTGSVEQASTVLKQLGAKGILMAGGTAFHFFSSEAGKTAGVPNDEQLRFISENNGFFEIGSFASISDLREFSNQGWVLDRVAEEFATQQIRNMSTLGGNISQVFPWSDFPVVLLALSAEINVLEEKESRAYEAVDFFRQQPGKFLKNGKIVKSVKIPVLE